MCRSGRWAAKIPFPRLRRHHVQVQVSRIRSYVNCRPSTRQREAIYIQIRIANAAGTRKKKKIVGGGSNSIETRPTERDRINPIDTNSGLTTTSRWFDNAPYACVCVREGGSIPARPMTMRQKRSLAAVYGKINVNGPVRSEAEDTKAMKPTMERECRRR